MADADNIVRLAGLQACEPDWLAECIKGQTGQPLVGVGKCADRAARRNAGHLRI